MDGFTVLSAISSHFGWDTRELGWFVKECNVSDKVIAVPTRPVLVLVPRTRSDEKHRARIYIEQLFEVAHSFGVSELQFTHYSFINRIRFKDEMDEVLSHVLNPKLTTNLERLYFDLDQRIHTYAAGRTIDINREISGLPNREAWEKSMGYLNQPCLKARYKHWQY